MTRHYGVWSEICRFVAMQLLIYEKPRHATTTPLTTLCISLVSRTSSMAIALSTARNIVTVVLLLQV